MDLLYHDKVVVWYIYQRYINYVDISIDASICMFVMGSVAAHLDQEVSRYSKKTIFISIGLLLYSL